jgi:hypothetical protein
MKAMKRYKKTLLTAAVIAAMASCTTEEAVITAPEKVIERIDMVLEGSDTEFIFLQSPEDEIAQDLIQYNFYGNPSHQIDFKVNLDEARTLIFRVVNEADWNPWETESSYSVYASQDLEDKQKYVTVELTHGGEVPAYQSNIGGEFPQGTYLNVFRIERYDPSNNEILCRIIDLELVPTAGDHSDILTVNGTFRGALPGDWE